ncbi:LLM class flavin-dependent oxidoreductase [Chloroflexi bacterium TSY]|nr:LLM class flavin-dependent oxidoreductase [Chloroflexi bacterium TSY]
MKIGFLVNHMKDPVTGVIPTYAEIREMAQVVEAHGFDSIWLVDHLFFRFEGEETAGIWECWTLLSALAEATERVELGTLVLCNPFRNPALLAKMAHTLDEVSQGRLILGVGAGWHQPEFDAFGFPFDRRVGRFEEALQIMKPLLQGEPVDFAGTHYQVQNCEITPLGPRTEGVPLLVASFGPRMLRLTARYADQWNTAWLGDPQELGERLEGIQNACAEVNRDPTTLTITVGVSIAFPDLGETNTFAKEPLSGSTHELAQAFAAYEEAGVDHLPLNVSPYSLPALERVTAAIQLYRGE